MSEEIQSSRRVLVPSPPQASHLQLHLCPLLPHTGISRCTLLFQRMTINAQSTPGVRSPGAHPPLCSFTLPQTLNSLGPSGRDDRFEIPNCLAAWATSSPILLVIHVEVGVRKESYSTIPYYPWTFPPLPISPLPNPTFHFPYHILKGRNAQGRQTQEPSSPRHPRVSGCQHSSCWPPSPTAILSCSFSSLHSDFLPSPCSCGGSCVDL